MELPYYATWTSQNDKFTFEIDKTSDHSFTLIDGSEIIDLSSISAQVAFGLQNKKISDAVKKQIDNFSIASAKSTYKQKTQVTNKLLDLINMDSRGKIFYTVSGAESVENAIKMARVYTKKNKILARKNSYHGASIGALSLTGDWRNQGHLTLSDYTIRIPEPSEDDSINKIEKIIIDNGPETIAAFCLETITGANGVYFADESWWKSIRSLCDKYNILLIVDEVICGFYRTSKAFGIQNYNISPDIMCLAKAISGGIIPFGAVWTNDSIAQYFDKNMLSCGLTNYAHPLGMAALEAVLEICNDNNFTNNLKKLESILENFLIDISTENLITTYRRVGLLCALEFDKEVGFEVLFKKGIYTLSKPKMTVLAPHLTLSESELKSQLDKFKKVLVEIKRPSIQRAE